MTKVKNLNRRSGLQFPGEGVVRISIIIPVYNPGNSIYRCIESLREQLLEGLEFIFVDDVSTDGYGSTDVIQKIADTDTRVRVIKKKYRSRSFTQ